MKHSIFDDGFQSYLTEDAIYVGEPEIPMLMDLHNVHVPKRLISYKNINTCKDRHGYVHFYQFDKTFSIVLTATKQYISKLKLFDGVITPDCSMLIHQSKCLQQANTYMNRAVGFYLQKNGIPVIPNVRWSDESSFKYCFLGTPKNSIVCVSTHGCISTKDQKKMFKYGLTAMIDELSPTDILVHGNMPASIFEDFMEITNFHRYPSDIEVAHSMKGGA